MEFLESLYNLATEYIFLWGYWGLIVGMAIESACIPLPSEIILPFGGFMVSKGILSFWPAALAGTLGGTIGSLVAYLVGYFGGRPFILRYGRYIFIRPQDLALADNWFRRYGNKAVFWARLMPVIRTFISLPAGITRMNLGGFLVYTVLGSLPWCILFTYLGVKMGENWAAIRRAFEELDIIIIAVLALLVVFWIVKKARR